ALARPDRAGRQAVRQAGLDGGGVSEPLQSELIEQLDRLVSPAGLGPRRGEHGRERDRQMWYLGDGLFQQRTQFAEPSLLPTQQCQLTAEGLERAGRIDCCQLLMGLADELFGYVETPVQDGAERAHELADRADRRIGAR